MHAQNTEEAQKNQADASYKQSRVFDGHWHGKDSSANVAFQDVNHGLTISVKMSCFTKQNKMQKILTYVMEWSFSCLLSGVELFSELDNDSLDLLQLSLDLAPFSSTGSRIGN